MNVILQSVTVVKSAPAKKKWRMRFQILALLATVASETASQPPAPGGGDSQSKSPSASKHPDSSGAPIASAPGQAIAAAVQNVTGEHGKKKEAAQPTHDWWASPDWWLVALTAALGFATWKLVVRTRDLVDEAKATNARQAEETTQALAIAKTAADAAKLGAEAADKTLRMTHRANVSIKSLAGRCVYNDQGLAGVVIWADMENVGATNAIDCVMAITVRVSEVAERPDVGFVYQPPGERGRPVTQAPQTPFISPKATFRIDEMTRVHAGNADFFVWVTCAYSDIFESAHFSERCFFARLHRDPTAVRPGDDASFLEWIGHARNNTSD